MIVKKKGKTSNRMVGGGLKTGRLRIDVPRTDKQPGKLSRLGTWSTAGLSRGAKIAGQGVSNAAKYSVNLTKKAGRALKQGAVVGTLGVISAPVSLAYGIGKAAVFAPGQIVTSVKRRLNARQSKAAIKSAIGFRKNKVEKKLSKSEKAVANVDAAIIKLKDKGLSNKDYVKQRDKLDKQKTQRQTQLTDTVIKLGSKIQSADIRNPNAAQVVKPTIVNGNALRTQMDTVYKAKKAAYNLAQDQKVIQATAGITRQLDASTTKKQTQVADLEKKTTAATAAQAEVDAKINQISKSKSQLRNANTREERQKILVQIKAANLLLSGLTKNKEAADLEVAKQTQIVAGIDSEISKLESQKAKFDSRVVKVNNLETKLAIQKSKIREANASLKKTFTNIATKPYNTIRAISAAYNKPADATTNRSRTKVMSGMLSAAFDPRKRLKENISSVGSFVSKITPDLGFGKAIVRNFYNDPVTKILKRKDPLLPEGNERSLSSYDAEIVTQTAITKKTDNPTDSNDVKQKNKKAREDAYNKLDKLQREREKYKKDALKLESYMEQKTSKKEQEKVFANFTNEKNNVYFDNNSKSIESINVDNVTDQINNLSKKRDSAPNVIDRQAKQVEIDKFQSLLNLKYNKSDLDFLKAELDPERVSPRPTAPKPASPVVAPAPAQSQAVPVVELVAEGQGPAAPVAAQSKGPKPEGEAATQQQVGTAPLPAAPQKPAANLASGQVTSQQPKTLTTMEKYTQKQTELETKLNNLLSKESSSEANAAVDAADAALTNHRKSLNAAKKLQKDENNRKTKLDKLRAAKERQAGGGSNSKFHHTPKKLSKRSKKHSKSPKHRRSKKNL